MMTDAKGPTKVEVAHYDDGLLQGINFIRYVGGEVILHLSGGERMKEHGDFIVDAFNVYAETGMTPREMLAERESLKNTLRRLLLDAEKRMAGFPPASEEWFAVRDRARAALSPEKKEPKP